MDRVPLKVAWSGPATTAAWMVAAGFLWAALVVMLSGPIRGAVRTETTDPAHILLLAVLSGAVGAVALLATRVAVRRRQQPAPWCSAANGCCRGCVGRAVCGAGRSGRPSTNTIPSCRSWS